MDQRVMEERAMVPMKPARVARIGVSKLRSRTDKAKHGRKEKGELERFSPCFETT